MKLLKNRKGFTLIELMMVIAVIGILAAVLIPKLGDTKTEAKLAGLDVNLRTVEGIVHQVIHNYNDPVDAEEAILTKLNSKYSDIKNPINSATGIGVYVTNELKETNSADWIDVNGNSINSSAFAYKYEASPTTSDPPSTDADLAGVIFLEAYSPAGDARITVKLTSYDESGVPLTDDAVTITQ